MKGDLSHERLRSLLNYDPAIGKFFWHRFRSGGKLSLEAGSFDCEGYIQIMVEGGNYKAHRLAWFYVHGVWPSKTLDHIDGNKANNRIENLREATQAQNQANKPSRPSITGLRGVQKTGNRFRAQIRHNGKMVHLGSFRTKEAAAERFRQAAIVIHGAFVHPTIADEHSPLERRT